MVAELRTAEAPATVGAAPSPVLPEVNGEDLAPSLIQAILGDTPGSRPLLELQGELLMYGGQFLFHYAQDGQEYHKPIGPAALRTVFSGQPVDSGWMPPGVVRWGDGIHGTYVVMWIAPAKHTIQVLMPAAGADKKESAEEIAVYLPGMVFAGRGTKWYLWATKGREFSPSSEVLEAPLPNVHLGGPICWGDNKVPEANGSTIREAWELFISSPFNDHLAGGRSKAFPNDVRGQLTKLAKAKREYPLNDLVKTTRWGSIADAVSGTITSQEVGRW